MYVNSPKPLPPTPPSCRPPLLFRASRAFIFFFFAPGRDFRIFFGARSRPRALRARFWVEKSATFEPTSVSTPFRSGPGAIFLRFPTPGTSEFCGRATQFYTSPIFRERALKGAPGPSRGSRIEAKIAPGAPFKSDHRTPESLWAVPGRGEELISAPAGLPGPLPGASGSRIGARGPPRGFQPATRRVPGSHLVSTDPPNKAGGATLTDKFKDEGEGAEARNLPLRSGK